MSNFTVMTWFHWVKSVQMRSFFWYVFFCIWTDQFEYREMQTRKSPYLDNFHAVFVLVLIRVVPLKWPFHVILVTYNKKSTGFAAEQMYIPISDILITLKFRTRNQANTAAMSMYSFCLNSIHFTIIVCIESRKRIWKKISRNMLLLVSQKWK